MPDSLSVYVSELAGKHLPHLRHFGKLMLPIQDQTPFFSSLSTLCKLQTIEIAISLHRDPHFFMNAFATQISIYASSDLEEIIFHLAWEFQRWVKRRCSDSSNEVGDYPVEYDEWVMAENGRRDVHYTNH